MSTFLCFFVGLLSIVAYFVVGSSLLAITFWSYLIIPVVIIGLNKVGKNHVARFIFIPANCLYFTIANMATLLAFQNTAFDPGILNIYMFRHYGPSAIAALFILLDIRREPRAFILASVLSILIVGTFFESIQLVGIDLETLPRTKLGIALNEFFVWSAATIVMGMVLFLIYINSRYEKKFLEQNEVLAEQKEEISTQRDALEKAHGNLMSSINYAKRIQDALLPDKERLSQELPNHFILFKPRDVVSGDFYWAAKHKGLLYWVCADCTGHGVPGAFMTMVGMNLLNQIILEEDYNDPGQILEQLDSRLEQSLNTSDTTRKGIADGMDMAIAVINLTTRECKFAGAKRPLYYFKKGGEFVEIKGSKFPIGGGYTQKKSFETQQITFESHDRLYFFSDGYPDQYGGENKRKFMVKKFRLSLIDIQQQPLADQMGKLESALAQWQGFTKQTDDILVMGMELP